MNRLATVEQLRSHLSSKVGVEANDLLTLMLESAEAFVERYCGRRFSPDPELVKGEDTAPSVKKTVIVTPQDRLVRIPDVREVVSVVLGGMTLNEAFYMLGNYSDDSPANQITLLQTATPSNFRPESKLEITGRFGFKPTPPQIVDAVLTIAARRYRERDASFSDAVQMAEGSALSYFRSLPSNIQLILKSYKMPRIAVSVEPEFAIR